MVEALGKINTQKKQDVLSLFKLIQNALKECQEIVRVTPDTSEVEHSEKTIKKIIKKLDEKTDR